MGEKQILRFIIIRIEFEIARRIKSQKEIWSSSDWKICMSEGESMGLKMRM